MNFSPFPCVSSVQFSSVQYERCWLGLVIPSAARMAARERARPASDEFWRYGVLARQGPVKAAMADGAARRHEHEEGPVEGVY